MASFDALHIVESLDYSLRPYADKAGTIAEPTDAQINAFDKAMTLESQRVRKLIPELPDIREASTEEYFAALEKVEAVRLSKAVLATVENTARIHAALCSDSPSFEDLMKLPRRVRMHFFAWLREEVTNPEAAAGAGNGKVLNLPSSAAG